MTGPSIAPFHVDAARIGGSKAAQRHSFGVAQAPQPKKPRFIPPPEKRALGMGLPKSPELSQAEITQIQNLIGPIAEALQYELEAVKVEADWVSGPTLRVEPDLYKSISIVGPYLTPQEIRSLTIVDASEIENAASRVLTGSLSPYLSAQQRSTLETVVSDAKKLSSYMQQFDLVPLTGASAKLAQDHVDSHVAAVLEDIKNVERNVVSSEAASVPVVEPMERGIGVGGLIAVGTLIAVGIIVADLI